VPTERQRRQAAARKIARQLARRQEEAARRRKRNQLIGIVATVVVVAGIVVGIVIGTSGGDKKAAAPPSSSATTSEAPATTAAKPSATPTSKGPTGSPYPTHAFPARTHKPLVSTGPCKYTETADLLKDTNARDVGIPPDPNPTPSEGTATLTLTTSQGPIEITLDRASAPCGVQSVEFLAKKGFYNNTACPRVVTSGIFVLQCGDPSNTQGGGPTYRFSEEINQHTNYDAGSVAMANAGEAASTGSQFFMVYKASNQDPQTGSGLARNYSVIGKITKGLDLVTKVAKGGAAATAAPSPGASPTTGAPTDGKPILGLTIISAKVS
jgi:peptidyl-prolyl cis-trans isomerase B (cyclophilin B)